MILQALKEYYDRKAADPESGIAPEGWEKKEIGYVIVVDNEGKLIQIEDTFESDGKKKKAKSFIVPQGVKRASGIAANLLWDNIGYVLGVDTKGKPERAIEQKNAFIKRVEDDIGLIEEIKPILAFLKNISIQELESMSLWNDLVSSTSNISFRMNFENNLIFENKSIRDAINKETQKETEKSICLVTGKKDSIANLHVAIKGVWGAQSAGANIVSFNLPAFRSFNKEQGFNAPIGDNCAFAYTTALNTLLEKDSRQRLQIGDTSTVFWSEKKSTFENNFSMFFAEPPKDNPDEGTEKIRELYKSVQSGAFINSPDNSRFYVLGLSPNAARISVRFWQVGLVSEFAERIKTNFDDLAIVKHPKEPEFYPILKLLGNIASLDKIENLPPNIAGDFMRAILNGTPYPATLLQAALRRIHSDTEHRVKPVRAALIKAYLNRYYRIHINPNHKEITMSLDINQPSVGYQLGRLFATLEKIQEEANPGLNATIRERYYGSACASPVTVFANLMRLKNHHLAKMENRGRVINFETILGEIMGKLTDFPAHLDLHEQGRFAIGYYHQRQDFFTKKEDVTNK
jgi:CRISPR-associated protein Csd1